MRYFSIEYSPVSRKALRMQNPDFVKKTFSAIAPRYVATNHILSMGIDVIWRMKVARQIKAWAPETLLDIATGTGDLALTIQGECPDIKITGSDFCPEMLAIAKERGVETIVEADALQLPFTNESFDCTTVAFGLRNMAAWDRALDEMFRVLTPGGHSLILDFSLPKNTLMRGPYRWYLHHILPKVAGLLTGHPEAYTYLGESIEQFPSGKNLCDLMEKSGFIHTQFTPLCGGIATLYTGEKPLG